MKNKTLSICRSLVDSHIYVSGLNGYCNYDFLGEYGVKLKQGEQAEYKLVKVKKRRK